MGMVLCFQKSGRMMLFCKFWFFLRCFIKNETVISKLPKIRNFLKKEEKLIEVSNVLMKFIIEGC